jgi:hypothetical protein
MQRQLLSGYSTRYATNETGAEPGYQLNAPFIVSEADPQDPVVRIRGQRRES